MRNDTLFELGTYADIDFKIKAPRTEIAGEVTITTLANAGVGSVGADANGKLIILDESALPSVTLNYAVCQGRLILRMALADSKVIYYHINFESDEDHGNGSMRLIRMVMVTGLMLTHEDFITF